MTLWQCDNVTDTMGSWDAHASKNIPYCQVKVVGLKNERSEWLYLSIMSPIAKTTLKAPHDTDDVDIGINN